jgi:hypothetical protein
MTMITDSQRLRAAELADEWNRVEKLLPNQTGFMDWVAALLIAGRNCAGATRSFATQSERVPQWISVNDRLPDESVRVLAWYADWPVRSDHPLLASCTRGQWWDVRRGAFMPGVTHWMPLPAAPQPEKRDE